jgi:hypothetical protein
MLTILRDYQKTVRPKGSANAFLGVMDQVP